MFAIDPNEGGTDPQQVGYRLIGAARTSRVTGDNTLQEIIQVTAQSKLFLVTYTWFVDPINWTATGARGIVGYKTIVVNNICEKDHVIGFRTTQDQDASRLLVNYAVITVGTDDGRIQDETGPDFFPIRMDALDTPAPYAAIDAIWSTLAAAGAR